MVLTVFIPTYNRPDRLKNTVARVLPQLTDDVILMILDNCSDVNIKDYLEQEFGTEAINKIRVVRHRVNIGADANFARGFELCETPYIWTLSDDDKIVSNGVELILAEIEKFKDKDLVCINFNSGLCIANRTGPVFISNITELAEKIDHFWNWVFLSTSVYKTAEYFKNIRFANWGAYSMVSQLLPAIKSISNNKVLVLSEKHLVDNLYGETPAWSPIQLNLGLTSFLELPVGFKKDEYLTLGRNLSLEFLPMGSVLLSLLSSIKSDISLLDSYHIYLFKQLYTRTIMFRNKRIYETIKYYIILLLLYNPVLLRLLLTCLPSLKQKINKSRPFYLFER